MAAVSQAKAKEILRDGTAQGHALTRKQKGYFGAIAGGATLKRAANGAMPAVLTPNQPNMVLVGDGGSDPAAEEYLLLPAGAEAIIAPKLSPKEKPSMSNAVRALAGMKLKKAASGVSARPTTAPTPLAKGVADRIASGQTTYLGPGMAYSGTNKPKAPAATTPAPALVIPGVVRPVPSAPTPRAPFDPGVGRNLTILPAASPAPAPAQSAIEQQVQATMPNFGRGARGILGMAEGMLRLKRAAGGLVSQLDAGGRVIGYTRAPSDPYGTSGSQPMSEYEKAQIGLGKQQMGSAASLQQQQLAAQREYQQAQLAYNQQQLAAQQGYWNASTGNQRYATDAQRSIAAQQIAAQNAQLAQQLGFNRERLALDRMLGERAAATDENRLKNEAMQNLMTRAGRQLVAPGGNVIPSMQPLIGRSIN